MKYSTHQRGLDARRWPGPRRGSGSPGPLRRRPRSRPVSSTRAANTAASTFSGTMCAKRVVLGLRCGARQRLFGHGSRDQVEQREQEDPHQVHQVPVEAGEIDRAEVLGAELAAPRADAGSRRSPPCRPSRGRRAGRSWRSRCRRTTARCSAPGRSNRSAAVLACVEPLRRDARRADCRRRDRRSLHVIGPVSGAAASHGLACLGDRARPAPASRRPLAARRRLRAGPRADSRGRSRAPLPTSPCTRRT